MIVPQDEADGGGEGSPAPATSGGGGEMLGDRGWYERDPSELYESA